ncbi:MAG: holo-ACP synthase [Pseudomonadota bacterium]
MISGIGVDVSSIKRIEESLLRFGRRFVERILHPDERNPYSVAPDAAAFMAKRFAIKEACAKALGTGIREGVSFHDFIVEHDKLGKPLLRIDGEAAARCQRSGIATWHISVSDEGDTVTAFAVFEYDSKKLRR